MPAPVPRFHVYYLFSQVNGHLTKKGKTMPNRGQAQETEYTGPRKMNGEPDLRFKENEVEGTPAYDARHRNPHYGAPPPERVRRNRPMGDPDKGDIVNADGTLDMRFLQNKIKMGLVPDPETGEFRTPPTEIKARQRQADDTDEEVEDTQVRSVRGKGTRSARGR
jgi:hypothetical protein